MNKNIGALFYTQYNAMIRTFMCYNYQWILGFTTVQLFKCHTKIKVNGY